MNFEFMSLIFKHFLFFSCQSHWWLLAALAAISIFRMMLKQKVVKRSSFRFLLCIAFSSQLCLHV